MAITAIELAIVKQRANWYHTYGLGWDAALSPVGVLVALRGGTLEYTKDEPVRYTMITRPIIDKALRDLSELVGADSTPHFYRIMVQEKALMWNRVGKENTPQV